MTRRLRPPPLLHALVTYAISSYGAQRPIHSEADLESVLCDYLQRLEFSVERQVRGNRGRDRYDLVCGHSRAPGQKCVVEVKMRARSSDLSQFDRYVERFPGGLVIACWTATKAAHDAVAQTAVASPVPVCLIELGLAHALA